MNKTFLKIAFFVSAVVFSVFCFARGASADVLNQDTPFFVDNSYDALNRQALMATLVQVSDHAYFYIEDDWWHSIDQSAAKASIDNLATAFDQIVYPKLTQILGNIWEPGIDNDSRITILISRIQEGAGGYFNTADEYPRDQAAHSNQRERSKSAL